MSLAGNNPCKHPPLFCFAGHVCLFMITRSQMISRNFCSAEPPQKSGWIVPPRPLQQEVQETMEESKVQTSYEVIFSHRSFIRRQQESVSAGGKYRRWAASLFKQSPIYIKPCRPMADFEFICSPLGVDDVLLR